MLIHDFQVDSPNVQYGEEFITSTYNYQSTKLERSAEGKWAVVPTSTEYEFRVNRKVPKLGCVALSQARCAIRRGARAPAAG